MKWHNKVVDSISTRGNILIFLFPRLGSWIRRKVEMSRCLDTKILTFYVRDSVKQNKYSDQISFSSVNSGIFDKINSHKFYLVAHIYFNVLKLLFEIEYLINYLLLFFFCYRKWSFYFIIWNFKMYRFLPNINKLIVNLIVSQKLTKK